MKYKILLVIVVIACYFGNTSCKKFLSPQPQFKFVDSLALNSLSGLYTTTIGGFGSLQSGSLYGGGIIAYGELLADFVNAGTIADFSLNQLKIHQMDADNAEANGEWDAAYYSIQVANEVLASLPRFQKADTLGTQLDSINLIKGENLFIRGAMHFELVRMYAQPAGYTANNSHLGVPIVLTPTTTLSQNQSVARSTVAQVYQQVISDLTAADSLLGKIKHSSTTLQVFANQAAAQGFLTRVYFEMNNFAMAQAWADSVTSNSIGLQLDNSLTQVDSFVGTPVTNSTEIVFECISTPPNNEINTQGAPLYSNFVPEPGSIAPLFVMSPAFADTLLNPYYKLGDKRIKLLYIKGPYFYLCKKYDDIYMNIPIMRLEEVILDRAECEEQLGNYAAARTDLNLILARAGLNTDNTSTGQGLLNEIRAQRDIELSMEGDRLFELKRRQWNFVAGYDSTIHISWNNPQLIYPIPLQEVQKNPNMVQNPGY